MEQLTIIDKINAHIEATGTSQNKVASAIGISPSALSTWLNGTYKGSVEQVNERVVEYLETVKERSQKSPTKVMVVETSAFRSIRQFCGLVLRDSEFGLLIGPAGFGKTTSLKEFMKHHKSCIMVEADDGYTARILFQEINDKLGLETKGNLHDLITRAIEKLEDSGRLIIIDEAEHLPIKALESIRRLHDKAGIGVILAGLPRLQKNITGDMTHFAQILSRLGAFCRIDGLTDPDVELIASKSIPELTSEMASILAKESKRNARVLSKLVRWCVRLMTNNNIPLSIDVIEQARSLITVAR